MGIGADLLDDHLDYFEPEVAHIKKQIKTDKMKSKIQEVTSASEPDSHGNIWHKLVMEDGSKIDIGKQKLHQVGWELEFEWKDGDDQQEYRKARTPKKEFTPSQSTQSDTKTFKADPLKQASIELQVCLKEANNYHAAHGFDAGANHLISLVDTTEYLYEKLFKK